MSVKVQQHPSGGGLQQQQQTPRHHQPSSSLLACVRESSPLPDNDDDAADSYSGVAAEPSSKKRRFHPLRGLRRMFRRKPRVEATAPEPVLAAEEVCGEPAGNTLLLPADPTVHQRSLSASELLGGSPELQVKRRSGGGLSGGSGGGGSGGALGSGLSVSHDSVFTSEARAGSSSPRGGGSALDLPEYEGTSPLPGASALALQPQPLASHAGVRAELFEAVRRRRGRGRGRGGDASEDEDEDLGLPSSPYGGSPTTADVLMERSGIKEAPTKSHSTCSDGSLLSMGSSEMDEDSQMSGHSSKLSLHDRSPLDTSQGTFKDPDLEMLGQSVGAPLSHSAARHKIAVRPRRTHGAPRNRRLQQVVSAALPVTPEAVEEFPRSYSPDNRGKRDLSLPAIADLTDSVPDSRQTPEPVFVFRTPPDGMPAQHVRPPPAGLSPNSPEALLASVMLERQLKSTSLPPGLALPLPATTTTEPTVKLSRSQSSSDPPASPTGHRKYRRAVSAVQLEQAALANAAVSRSRAMLGSKEEKHVMTSQCQGRPEQTSPLKEEKPIVSRLPLRKADEGKVEPTSPVKDEKSIFSKPPIKPELSSPVKEEKMSYYKPSRKLEDSRPEPLSLLRYPEDSPVHQQDSPPVPGPKPEVRKVSSAALRQRVEPGLMSQEVSEDAPVPWTPPANKVSVSHFIKLADPKPCEPDVEVESVTLRHKETPAAPAENRLSVKSKISDYQALLQDSPSSLDSLETETAGLRRLRSLSQSPVDSLERTELKMSSDSLSSGADMSSTSDDPRPYLKHRRPRRPTPDTSDPDEGKPDVPRPVKLRTVSRHSDPPFSGKNAVEITSVIRKSVSVESMRSMNESNNNNKNSSTNDQQAETRKSTSNDSISSFENTESESSKNITARVTEQEKEVVTCEPRYGRIKRTSSKLTSDDTKSLGINPPEPLSLSLVCDQPKTDSDILSKSPKSPSPKWDSKPRLSISTPSVHEFLRVQLHHVDSTPASNIILSTSTDSVDTSHRRHTVAEKPAEKPEVIIKDPENEISAVRDRLLRKSVIDEPKVVEVSEKVSKEVSTESVASILNRRPSQVKRQELAIKALEPETKVRTEVQSPTEKVTKRISSVFLKEAEVKPRPDAPVTAEKTPTQRYSVQSKVSIVPATIPKPVVPEVKSPKTKPVESNISIVPKTPVSEQARVHERRSVSPQKPVPVEKPVQITKQSSVAPKLAERPVEVQEVVLRRKSIAPDTKEEPELFKVFARRSLKLNKDTDSWENQAPTQKSRDSDKENEDNPTEFRDRKPVEARNLNSSIANNNVTGVNNSNNNNNNNNIISNLRRPARNTQSMGPPSININNNQEVSTTDSTRRTPSPETRPRPKSVVDMFGVGKNIELREGDNTRTAPPASPLPAVVTGEDDKSMTPQVRRRMQQWERLSKKP